MLKAAIRHGSDKDKIRHRILPQDAVNKWVEKLDSLKDEISEILQEEKEEKQVHCFANALYILSLLINLQFRQAEMELKKGQNIIEHRDEIYSRPARTWFQTEKEKKNSEGDT